jgi:hypothetical protein
VIEFDRPFWSVTVFRNGTNPEVITTASLPEAIRKGRQLSDAGLVGCITSYSE